MDPKGKDCHSKDHVHYVTCLCNTPARQNSYDYAEVKFKSVLDMSAAFAHIGDMEMVGLHLTTNEVEIWALETWAKRTNT